MQVKKFEARTMKEALEMVKSQLGPDAIILSARDNNKSYGLVGEGSVEITAAVSEETLQKKKFTESRLREQDREKFQRSSARSQKELIEKMVNRHVAKNQPIPAITQRRYIDIEDENNHLAAAAPMPASARNQQAVAAQNVSAEERIRKATQRALAAMGEDFVEKPLRKAAVALARDTQKAATSTVKQTNVESSEMLALRNEIASLKNVITQFQSVPQTFSVGHPGNDYGIPYDLSFMFEKLTNAGVADDVAAEMLDLAQNQIPAIKMKNRSLIEGWVARHILETTKISAQQTSGKIHCFVGPAGAGKTSSLIKMASQMVIRENKKIALISTDTYKVGAADQMRIYAQILNVPFSIIRNQNDWNNIMRYISNLDAVLVDFTGLSLKNSDEMNLLKNFLPPSSLPATTHLVLPATTKDQDATELGRRYSILGCKDVIFTGLDESAQHGTIYNFMRNFDMPLHSFGIGSRVPEDFEFATKERVLDLIFKITKVKEQEPQAV